MMCLFQADSEIGLCPGIPGHKHIVRNHSQINLYSPHPGPDRRIVVDIPEQGRLGADLGTGISDPCNGLFYSICFQFPVDD